MIRALRDTPKELTHAQQVETELLATLEPLGRRGQIWIGTLVAVVGFAFFAYVYQLANGLRVTGMRDFVSWGVYMTNFVFFIGISHAGTLISAILRVTQAEWRRPITRLAEAITVFALIIGGAMIIIDMGRPDRVLNIIRYGRLSSPILWDVCSITTYLTGSFIYLYVAMIPDLPMAARAAQRRGRPQWRVRLYQALALGYRGTPAQERFLNRALGAMAVIIIPVAVSVHTVVSWLFGMTVRPGWHSTIFGPYFVIGAIFSGTAALITAMALVRWAYRRRALPDGRSLPETRRASGRAHPVHLLHTERIPHHVVWWLETEARLLNLLTAVAVRRAFWFWVVTGCSFPLVS
jgi:molybdopterin-containing oxidoreductase family membrane subunit